MSSTSSEIDPGPNSDQAAFWGGTAGDNWVALQELMDRQLEPFGQLVLNRAEIRHGISVLDVGCGCGATSIFAASLVGNGKIVGCDISGPMLALASSRASDLANTVFVHADAQVYEFGQKFDRIISRFGVMFFDDPTIAFGNLRKASTVGGTLSFVCWRSAAINEFAYLLGDAVNEVLGPPPLTSTTAPGPYAFGDKLHLESVLDGSGWTTLEIESLDVPMHVYGSNDIDEVVDASLKIGSASRRLIGKGDDLHSAVREVARSAIERVWTPRGWVCDGKVWLVHATNRT